MGCTSFASVSLTDVNLYVCAQALVLSETVVLPFRDDVRSKIGHLSGDRLELRAGGQSLQQQFREQVTTFRNHAQHTALANPCMLAALGIPNPRLLQVDHPGSDRSLLVIRPDLADETSACVAAGAPPSP